MGIALYIIGRIKEDTMVIMYDFEHAEGQYSYEVNEFDALDALKDSDCLEEEDLEKDIDDIDFDQYWLDLEEIFRDEAEKEYKDLVEYSKSPLHYYGMKESDFL